MAKVTTKGLNETIKMFEEIGRETDEIFEAALREGGGKVTDVMRDEISVLKTSDKYKGGDGKGYPNKKDVQGLLDSLGYTPVKSNGTVFDINTGFDGYNNRVTKKYPKGHANQMIANSINKGTSFLIAQPFINKTSRAAKASALEAIERKLDEEIKKISK